QDRGRPGLPPGGHRRALGLAEAAELDRRWGRAGPLPGRDRQRPHFPRRPPRPVAVATGLRLVLCGTVPTIGGIRPSSHFRADHPSADRARHARVLVAAPAHVVPRPAEIIREGPRPLREVTDAPCHEQVLTGDDVDLSGLPVVRHTPLDPWPYTTSFAVHRD